MTTNYKIVAEDPQFQQELASAGSKLVVADFFATWCGPCQRIAPIFEEFSTKYPNAIFLKIDVDLCQETAQSQGVSAMPTFMFYRNKVRIDTQKGADPKALEEKIKKWYGEEDEGEEEVVVKGHMDLSTFISKSGCECLNESDDHPLAHALSQKGGFLESDVDEQLIISLAFSQPVKLHSLKVNGPAENAPKTIKIFINQPTTLDFDGADSMEPVQKFILTPDDVKEGALVQLRYVKFQNVQNITFFIKDNLGDADTTQIDYIGVIGSPVQATNMSDFKRVAGKKGESH
ncbi:thioredoxin-like protein 1 [Haliotis rubra]|uniref:thioredoxin-like protein 1 n=1 Tax=Haliotis rubra TaxID=36100 RepID=UPI001EE567E1|nr:thioredoxin-like protein 1 [Haliotis rubra]